MHILIVDDAADMRRSLQLLLNQVGYAEVSVADSGPAAFELLQQSQRQTPNGSLHSPAAAQSGPSTHNSSPSPVDVILLDVMMPHMDGIEACRQIKAHREWRDIPIIMVTALNDEFHLSKAFDAGAMDYLTKPVRFTELVVRLRSAFVLKHELDTRRSREQELLHVTEELAAANQLLQRLATLDSLTGLANRRCLDAHLAREWRRCVRSGTWLSVLMADVDLFKRYNDHYGHQAGDECLQRVAGVWQAAVRRPGDMAARFGGEEFLLVLPGTDAMGLTHIAEKIRSDVEHLNLPHAESTVAAQVTLSLGGASLLPHRTGRPDDLVGLADAALYEAKNEGRNRVRLRGAPISQHAGAPAAPRRERPNPLKNSTGSVA